MKIQINRLNWEIKEVETRSQELVVNGNQCYGTCKYHTQEIFLDATLKGDKKYQVLKHELTHAFIFCYLLEQKKSYSEEDLCEFIALYSEGIIDLSKQYMLKEGI